MSKVRWILTAALLITFAISPSPASAAVPEMISTAQYPVGIDEDSVGNIYIASENNSANSSNIGLVVIPKFSGTLFGQSVTANQEHLLFAYQHVRGVAVDANNDLLFSTSDGKLFALASTARTIFGVSVPANVVTQLFSGTSLKGPLQFDSSGNLFGIHASSNVVTVISPTARNVFGVSAAANIPTVVLEFTDQATNTAGWFWDLAIDTSDNLLLSFGFSDLAGVWILPKSSGTSYGQALTANNFIELSAFSPYFGSGTAGIDVDSSGNVFVARWGESVWVYSPSGQDMFGQNIDPATPTQIIRTKYGRTNQGVAASSTGALITGGGSGTYFVAQDSTEPNVQSLSLTPSDQIYVANYSNEPQQNFATWGKVSSSDSTLTEFSQTVGGSTEGGGYDSSTSTHWLMKNDCSLYTVDPTDQNAASFKFTVTTGYDSECRGFATRDDGTALITTGGSQSDSKLFVINLQDGSKITSDPLNGLLIAEDALALAIAPNGDIWICSNYSWNLHKVDPSNGQFTDMVPFYDITGTGMTSMDFDSTGRLIGTYFGLSEGIASIDMNAANPMSTAVLNETTDRYGWSSRALWIGPNLSPSNNQVQNNPAPNVSQIESVATVAKSISTGKFKFGKGQSFLSKANSKFLLQSISEYKSASKITISASAGYLNGVSKKRVERLALKRANSIKAMLVKNGIDASKITIELNVVKFGVAPKSSLLYTL